MKPDGKNNQLDLEFRVGIAWGTKMKLLYSGVTRSN